MASKTAAPIRPPRLKGAAVFENASRLKLVSVVAIGLLLVLTALVLKGWFCRIFSLAHWDFGPAYRAIDLRNFILGKPLYSEFRAPPYHDANAYNPLCYYLAAWLVPLFAPSPISYLEAGRLLVVLSTISACLLVFLNAHRSGAATDAAIIAAAAFALSPILQPWGFEFRVDVPALTCELAGLYAFQSGQPFIAVALFELAFLGKQGFVSGLLAVIVYLWLNHTPRALPVKLAATWLAATAACGLALQIRYPNYLLNTYYALSPIYDLSAAPYFMSRIMFHHLPLFLLAVANILRKGVRNNLFAVFWIVALCHDTFAATRWGSNFNYFLPTLAATAILSAPELSILLTYCSGPAKALQIVMGAIIAGVVLTESWSPLRGGVPEALAYCSSYRSLRCSCGERFPYESRPMKMLALLKGPVLTDIPDLLLLGASPELEDPAFMVLMPMQLNGQFDDRRLLADVEKKRFVALALDRQLLDREWRGFHFFWPSLRKALQDNYAPVSTVGPPFLMIRKAHTRDRNEVH